MLHTENIILLVLLIVLILLISVCQGNNTSEKFFSGKLGNNLKTKLNQLDVQFMNQIKNEVTQSDKIQELKNRINGLSIQVVELNTNSSSSPNANVNKLYNTNGVVTNSSLF